LGCEVRTSLRCPEPSGLLPAVWEDLDGRYAATQKSSHIHGPDTMTSGGNATVVVCNADGLPPGRDPGQAQLGSVSDCQRSFCLNAISSPGLLLSLSNDFYVPPRGTIAMALAPPQGGGTAIAPQVRGRYVHHLAQPRSPLPFHPHRYAEVALELQTSVCVSCSSNAQMLRGERGQMQWHWHHHRKMLVNIVSSHAAQNPHTVFRGHHSIDSVFCGLCLWAAVVRTRCVWLGYGCHSLAKGVC